MKKKLLLLSLLLIIFAVQAEEIKTEKEVPKEETTTTQSEIKIKGSKLSYKSTAGTLLLKKDDGTPEASIFYVSYTKEGNNTKNRPITFCFNGGPGSSSVWLHLGAFGPKRVVVDDKIESLPPYSWIDNEYTLLEETDLVFIDPVSTGYSRAIQPKEAKDFHSYNEDIKSIAEFIRLYLTRNGRWDSPKYLAGESYGSTRAVGLASYLYEKSFIYINGIILISACLNFQSVDFCDCNDTCYINFLPSYVASAWYHKKLSPEFQNSLADTLSKTKEFIFNEYARALLKGDLLQPDERKTVVEKLSAFTGLSPAFIEMSDLRINMSDYSYELLKDKKEVIGRFDARVKGVNSDLLDTCSSYDPSFDNVLGAFTAAYNQYLQDELKWKSDTKYKIIANVRPWNFQECEDNNRYLNVVDTLKTSLDKSPGFKLFIANGYFDLATPFFGTECSLHQLGLGNKFQERVSMKYYDAGHMMYLHQPSLVKLKKDLSEFFQKH